MEENKEFKGGMITEEALEKVAGGLDVEKVVLVGLLGAAGIGIAGAGIGQAAKGIGKVAKGFGDYHKNYGKGYYYVNKKQ